MGIGGRALGLAHLGGGPLFKKKCSIYRKITVLSISRVLDGVWEINQLVYICFVNLQKAFDHVPQGVLGESCGGGGGLDSPKAALCH